MEFISKYDGLKKIEIFNLPHPNWIFVETLAEIPPREWANAPHGWTIRICPKAKHRFGLPSRHRLKFHCLEQIMDAFLKNIKDPAVFAIYPSWEYICSGCCLVSSVRIIIEAVHGDIAPLLQGRKNPDAVYVYDDPFYLHMTSVVGDKDILTSLERNYLLRPIRKILVKKEITLEWTKTTENRLIFHDWTEQL